jgi:hypothetical protein
MKKVLALVLAVTMATVGCSAAWVSTFESYLAIAGPAVIQILEIVALAKGAAVSPAVIAKVNGDAKALQTLVQSIQTASAANLPTACAAFNEGVKVFAADVPTLEQIGQLSNPTTQAQVADALQLVESTIAEIETPIASCQTSGASFKTAVAASRVKSPSDFASQYNKIMARDKTTSKYRVHVHGKFTRYATFGIAK